MSRSSMTRNADRERRHKCGAAWCSSRSNSFSPACQQPLDTGTSAASSLSNGASFSCFHILVVDQLLQRPGVLISVLAVIGALLHAHQQFRLALHIRHRCDRQRVRPSSILPASNAARTAGFQPQQLHPLVRRHLFDSQLRSQLLHRPTPDPPPGAWFQLRLANEVRLFQQPTDSPASDSPCAAMRRCPGRPPRAPWHGNSLQPRPIDLLSVDLQRPAAPMNASAAPPRSTGSNPSSLPRRERAAPRSSSRDSNTTAPAASSPPATASRSPNPAPGSLSTPLGHVLHHQRLNDPLQINAHRHLRQGRSSLKSLPRLMRIRPDRRSRRSHHKRPARFTPL
jgi:hypothetical protein